MATKDLLGVMEMPPKLDCSDARTILSLLKVTELHTVKIGEFFFKEFSLLYSRDNNLWVGGVQGLTSRGDCPPNLVNCIN